MTRRSSRSEGDPTEHIPDVRDGLTRIERVVLAALRELQRERGGRSVSTAELYGRVVEHMDLHPDELQEILARLGGRAAELIEKEDGSSSD